MDRDETPVTISDIHCVAEGRKAVRCEFLGGEFDDAKWVPKSLIGPGIDWRRGVRGSLVIAGWFWRRWQSEGLHKAAPKSEFEVDRYFARVKILCETRDKLDAGELFDQLLGPMYLAMRDEIHAMQLRIDDARDQLFELGTHSALPVRVKLEEIARYLSE